MVNWYKHDIPAWMDGTEALSDGAYRAYHVICQLIYLTEGSIARNEKGIAGRCGQSLRAFRRNLEELINGGKLTLENGRLSNARADFELKRIGINRINAGKGGEKSGERRKSAPKSLKNNDTSVALLQERRSLIDKTRKDESSVGEHARAWLDLKKEIVRTFEHANSPHVPDISHIDRWRQQGYELDIVRQVLISGISQKPGISSLSYFNARIRETHERHSKSVPAPVPDWEFHVENYAKERSWPPMLGPEPGMAGCRCANELLAKHGIDPNTGEPVMPAWNQATDRVFQIVPVTNSTEVDTSDSQDCHLALVTD